MNSIVRLRCKECGKLFKESEKAYSHVPEHHSFREAFKILINRRAQSKIEETLEIIFIDEYDDIEFSMETVDLLKEMNVLE